MEIKHSVALIVHSCDRYEFLYKGFEFFFTKYWDFDIDCKCYFATEDLNVSIKNFTTIQSGKGEWADRLSFLLNKKIPEKYILYVQEDMWLDKKVNANFFNQLFDLTEKNNWKQVKLHSSDVYKTIGTDVFIEGFNLSRVDNEKSDFLMSHQITLWEKDFLIKQLYKKEHPWRNERRATKRLKKINPQIFQVDYFAENGNKEININVDPVLRSGYNTISHNGTLSENVMPYIQALRSSSPEDQKYADNLAHNYANLLTHDGKPRPKKIDIFKRTKNWIVSKKRKVI